MVSVFATKITKFNLLIYYLLKNIFSFAIGPESFGTEFEDNKSVL